MVLASQSRDVLLQLGEGSWGRGLVRLERQSWISIGILWFIWLGSFRARSGRLFLALGGEEGALEGDGMQRAGVGVHLFGPTGHQVCAVARVQLGFWMEGGGGVKKREEGRNQGVTES